MTTSTATRKCRGCNATLLASDPDVCIRCDDHRNEPSEEECGACHRTFPTLAEVFSHPCDSLPRHLLNTTPHTDTSRGDSIDAPERREGHGTPAPKPERTNRYPGDCVRCHQRVEANAGLLVKNFAGGRGSSWGVEHRPGQCPTAAAAPAPAPEPVQAPAAGQPMSPAQEKFLRDLLAERQPDADADGVVAVVNDMPNPRGGASAMIDTLQAMPRPPRNPAIAASSYGPYEPTKGDVHVIDGEFYRVHAAQHSGRFYAVRWTGSDWAYDRGAIRQVTADNKATAEDAARFGELFHCCVFCTRPLDTPESTAVGYGPVCAAKRGLPWG